MNFPKLTNQFILDRLQIPDGKIDMVLDTDTYNEGYAIMTAIIGDGVRLTAAHYYSADGVGIKKRKWKDYIKGVFIRTLPQSPSSVQ